MSEIDRSQGVTVRRTIARALARALAASLPLVGSVLVLAGPAVADDGSLLVDVPGDGVGFTHDAGAPLLHVSTLYPGSSGSGVVDVRNTSAYDAALGLAVVDLESQENSCVRPETRDPGELCASDGGELDRWLEVSVAREGAGSGDAGQVLWTGRLSALTSGVDLGTTLGAGQTTRLRLTLNLPLAAPNDTMTDSVDFATRISATSVAGTSVVAGPQVGTTASPPPASSLVTGPHVALPGTGGSVSLWMLLLDALVLVAGGLLVVAARRGRRVA